MKKLFYQILKKILLKKYKLYNNENIEYFYSKYSK